MHSITILFGEMGSGKTHVGKCLANLAADLLPLDEDDDDFVAFFDGDDVIPEDMRKLVAAFKPIPFDILDEFVHGCLLSAIMEECGAHDLVVAQALYLDEHRVFLKNALEELGYKVNFRWVKTSFMRNMSQLWSRKNGARWIAYWLLNKPFFEEPTHDYRLI